MNENFNNLPPKRQAQLMAFDRLLTIMDELREQCPWDKKQTIERSVFYPTDIAHGVHP